MITVLRHRSCPKTSSWTCWVRLTLCSLLVCAAAVVGAADPVIELPKEDRAELEKFLGKGVLGKAVPAPTIKSSSGRGTAPRSN